MRSRAPSTRSPAANSRDSGAAVVTELDGDDGAAVVDFVLLTVALIFLLFAVLQVGVYVYARNVISAAAAEGARSGAGLGADPDGGARRAESLVARGLTGAVARDVPCQGSAAEDPDSHLPVTTVRCHGRLGLLFVPLPLPLTVDVSASALQEQQP